MADTAIFRESEYIFAGQFNPRWDGYAPEHPLLAVTVFMSNDTGDKIRMTVYGPSVDEAITRLLEERERDTGDDSWQMDEWMAA